MDSQKQVLHFEAKSGFTTAQSNEHQRRWTEKGWESANANGRIDRSRVALNFEIVRGGKVQARSSGAGRSRRWTIPNPSLRNSRRTSPHAASRTPTPDAPMRGVTVPWWTSSSAVRTTR